MDLEDIGKMEFANGGSLLEAILKVFKKRMTTPADSDYLPKLVPKLNNPCLAPYRATDDWTLNNLAGSSIVTASNQICIQSTPSKYSPAVGMQCDAPNLKLSNIVVDGLTNVQPEEATVTDPDGDAPKVVVPLDFCTITGNASIPEAITICGNFALSQTCCIPLRGATSCAPGNPTFGTTGTGTFTATISVPPSGEKIQMVNHATITVDPSGNFVVKIDSVDANIPEDALNTVVVISTSDPHKSAFERLAEEALNSDGGKKQLIGAFVAELTSPNTLNEIGNMMTKRINEVFSIVREASQ